MVGRLSGAMPINCLWENLSSLRLLGQVSLVKGAGLLQEVVPELVVVVKLQVL